MMEIIKKRLGNLVSVNSLVTLVLKYAVEMRVKAQRKQVLQGE